MSCHAVLCATSSVDNTTDFNGFYCCLALRIAPFASSVDTVLVKHALYYKIILLVVFKCSILKGDILYFDI